MPLRLDTDVQYVKGVGPKMGSMLRRRGVEKVKDLVELFPRAYEDRRAARNIASLELGDIVSLKAQIVSVSSFNMGRSHRKIYDVLVRDSSGQIHCKFFRVPYRGYFERFQPQQIVQVIGKVIEYRGRKEFHHPDIKDYNANEETSDSLLPLYSEIEGITSSKIAKVIHTALDGLLESEKKDSNIFVDPLPQWLINQFDLLSWKEAILLLHRPPADAGKEYNELTSQAHRRVIFDEFFKLEILLAAKRSGVKKESAPVIQSKKTLATQLITQLPFELTGAQNKALKDIEVDLLSGHPMHRLIQGDVGSGKTLVALLAVSYVAEAGFQCCLMAPTEILAEQHFNNAKKLLEPLGIQTVLITGKSKASEVNQALELIQSGQVQLVIGTHALIEDRVQFKNLALVIIDEQHRFGVHQRGRLKEKGQSPHFLVMTATPIPRTLAMTVYGDLDVTQMKEMPKGRQPIQTRAVYENKRPEVMKFMLSQIQKGRQVYIVYPLVEESEKIDLKDAVSSFENLKAMYPQYRFGLLHGKMKPQEKDEIMMQFRAKELDVLVATTVIEVGVDVPNANLIIIEHAERFGLSQLHQLRGRVGRGQHKSFCVLMLGSALSEDSKFRAQTMESTTDGFKIAEADLELRGPGEFMGTKQSGLAGFRIANLIRDVDILVQAREAAFRVLEKDPELTQTPHQALHEILKQEGILVG